MTFTNRVHPLLTMPDAEQRLARARIDLDYCRAVGRILYPNTRGAIPPDLCRTWRAAWQTLNRARPSP